MNIHANTLSLLQQSLGIKSETDEEREIRQHVEAAMPLMDMQRDLAKDLGLPDPYGYDEDDL